MTPAIGGKKNTLNSLITVNFQPSNPISIGMRATDQRDQLLRNATMVPILAPDRNNVATIGKLTYGPPGVRPPANVPINIPRIPDSAPTHFDNRALGKRVCINPAIIKAKTSKGRICINI